MCILLYCLYFSLSTILLDDHQQCLGLPYLTFCQLLSAVLFNLSHSGGGISVWVCFAFPAGMLLDILGYSRGCFYAFSLSSKSRVLYSGSFLEMLFQAPPQSCYISHFCFNKISVIRTLTSSCQTWYQIHIHVLPAVLLSPPVFCFDSFQTQGKIESILQWTFVYSSIKFTFNIFIVFVLSHCPSFHPSGTSHPSLFLVYFNIFQPSACLSLQFA